MATDGLPDLYALSNLYPLPQPDPAAHDNTYRPLDASAVANARADGDGQQNAPANGDGLPDGNTDGNDFTAWVPGNVDARPLVTDEMESDS